MTSLLRHAASHCFIRDTPKSTLYVDRSAFGRIEKTLREGIRSVKPYDTREGADMHFDGTGIQEQFRLAFESDHSLTLFCGFSDDRQTRFGIEAQLITDVFHDSGTIYGSPKITMPELGKRRRHLMRAIISAFSRKEHTYEDGEMYSAVLTPTENPEIALTNGQRLYAFLKRVATSIEEGIIIDPNGIVLQLTKRGLMDVVADREI